MPTESLLSPEDQTRLDAAIAQLLADGLLWREHEPDRRAYNELARWRELARVQLRPKGWELAHHAPAQLFQIVPRRGKHRRLLKRDTALTLLVCRLLYAEIVPGLTPYPVVTIGELAHCCAGFGLQPDLAIALPELAALKLLRAAGSKTLRPGNPEQLIELLPTLAVVLPDSAIEAFGKPQPETTSIEKVP